jgi:hypothetical protein
VRRIFGPKNDEIEQLIRFKMIILLAYTVNLIVRSFETRKFSWARHIARIKEGRSDFKI